MTTVTQVPPPLQLRPRPKELVDTADPRCAPPTYPMQAVNMGVDLFDQHDRGDSITGLRRLAPYQYGHWIMQPMYDRALHCIIDTVSGTVFTRTLQPASPQFYAEKIIESLAALKMMPEIRWLHGLRVPPMDGGILDYTMVIVDFIHPTFIHAARRDLLKRSIPECGIKTVLPKNKVVLVPEFPDETSIAQDLWSGLHIMNKEWESDLYQGITYKQANARYTHQMEDHNIQTTKWQFHPFVNRRAE